MRGLYSAVLALGSGWWLTAAHAQDTPPDLDFLEYLGEWAAEDDEWLAIEEWQKDERVRDDDERRDKRPERQKVEDDEGE